MSRTILMISLLFTSALSFAGTASDAKIIGSKKLGNIGESVSIEFNSRTCTISAVGENSKTDGDPPKDFRLIFKCGNRSQVLWDISKPEADDFSFDEPNFELLWAGDKDGDGQVDLEMNMSPKYSCSKSVLFLSTKAKPDHLVGVLGNPKTVCE